MAQMPPAPPTFSELLAKVRSERGPVARQTTQLTNPGIKFKRGGGAPQDPISWILDIASRPLYSVTNRVNAANKAFSQENIAKVQQAAREGDVGSVLGTVLGSLGEQAAAPFKGFFGTDPENQKFTHELIEDTTDTVGRVRNATGANAPDDPYVDVQDNVNPVVKGVLGFAGDMALDPLTYIPGAAIAGGLHKAASAARRVRSAVRPPTGAAGAMEALTKAAPTAAKAAELPEVPTLKPGPVEGFGADVPPPALEGLADGSTAAQRVLGQPKAPERAAFGQQARAEAEIPRPSSEQVLTDPRIQRARQYLDELTRPDVVETGLTPLKSFDEWVDELVKTPGSEKMAVATDKGRKSLKEAVVYDDAAEALLPVDEKARRFLATVYDRYRSNHAKAAATGDTVDVLGNVRKAPKAKAAQSADPYGRFQRAIRQETSQARAEELLGSHLFSYLKRRTRPDTFDRAVADVNAVLQRAEQLDRLTTTARTSLAVRAILNTAGVDVIANNLARKGIARLQQGSQVGARLGSKARAEVRKALLESPVGKVLNRAELAEKNRIAKRAIEQRRAQSAAQEAKKQRIAEQVSQRERILGFLPKAIKDHFEHGFKYRSGKGVARSDEAQGVGWGINDKLLNGYFQWNIAQKAAEHWIEVGKTPKIGPRGGKPSYLSGPALARYIDENFTDDMRAIEEMLQGEGYQMWIGRNAEVAVPLSYTQMLGALKSANPDVIKFFFNPSTRVPFTNLQDAILAAVRPGSKANPAEIDRLLQNTLKDARGGVIKNPLVGGDRANYGFTPKRSKKPFDEWLADLKRNAPEDGFEYVPNKNRTGVFRSYSPDALRRELVETIVKASDDLYETVNDNALALGRRYEEEAFDLTKEEVDALVELADDPARMGAALDAVAHHVDDIEALGELGGATKDAVVMATARVGEALSKPELAYARSASKAADAAAAATKAAANRGRTPAQVDKAGVVARKKTQQKAMDDAIDEDQTLLRPDPLDSEDAGAAIARAGVNRRLHVEDASWDASAMAYADINARTHRMLDPFLKNIKASHGMENLYQVYHSFRNGSAARTAKVAKEFRDAGRKFGGPLSENTSTPIIRAAWDDWAAGRTPSDPRVAEAVQFIEGFMAGKFSGKDGSLNSYSFMRTPAGIDAINEQLKIVGLPEAMQFDVKAGVDAAKTSGRPALVEIMEQVKAWDPKDPLDTMMKLYGAAERVSTDAGVAQGLTRWMMNRGLASYEPRKGFVKVHFSGENRYGAMLDPDVYWSPEIAKELAVLDAVSRESRMFKGGFGTFIHDYFDVVQGAWKYAITLPRPGHHIRNMVGDASMTFVAEGLRHARRTYKDAWKVLHNRGNYSDLDVSKALEHYGEKVLPRKGDVLYKGKNGYDDLTVDQATDAMYRHGLLNSYQGLEDLVDVDNPFVTPRAAAFKRGVDTVFLRHTPVETVSASMSEARDHYARAQHFLQYVYKAIDDGRFKGDYERLFREAATQVKKHHPDGSMLTTFEAKYMRRIIPFYSWLRGALPAIVEGAIVHPGRTIAFPKASYNLAVSMGLNPDTLADPFPDDQLFPSFLTEQVYGPQFEAGGKYYGINPGVASSDVANLLLADPVHGIGGSISPILRLVPELATGGSMSTGSQIRDTSDYLDSSIPGVNYLSNITGQSVTGSAVSLLTTGKLDPQAQVAAGNKSDSDRALSALNWLLGMNVQNMSRPNYINYAEIEKRNREGGPSAQF